MFIQQTFCLLYNVCVVWTVTVSRVTNEVLTYPLTFQKWKKSAARSRMLRPVYTTLYVCPTWASSWAVTTRVLRAPSNRSLPLPLLLVSPVLRHQLLRLPAIISMKVSISHLCFESDDAVALVVGVLLLDLQTDGVVEEITERWIVSLDWCSSSLWNGVKLTDD